MRTMVAPGKWRDDGPSEAHLTVRQFHVYASSGDAMLPVLAPIVAAQRPDRVYKAPSYIECGAEMIRGKTPCARRLGHSFFHKSRASLERDASRPRRSRKK